MHCADPRLCVLAGREYAKLGNNYQKYLITKSEICYRQSGFKDKAGWILAANAVENPSFLFNETFRDNPGRGLVRYHVEGQVQRASDDAAHLDHPLGIIGTGQLGGLHINVDGVSAGGANTALDVVAVDAGLELGAVDVFNICFRAGPVFRAGVLDPPGGDKIGAVQDRVAGFGRDVENAAVVGREGR